MKTNSLLPILLVSLAFQKAQAANLIVHYTFEGDLSDQIGDRDGVFLNPETVLDTSGAPQGTGFLSLNPVGDQNTDNVGFQSTGDDLDLGSGAVTVAFFARIAEDLSPSTRATFFSLGNGQGQATGERFDLALPDTFAPFNALRIEVNGNGGGGGDLGGLTANLGDGNWHHFAVTRPESATLGQVELFVDGVSVGTVGAGNDPAINTAPSAITLGDSFGLSSGNSFRGLTGGIDDFRIYDGVLTPAEILALANPDGAGYATWAVANGLTLGGNGGFFDNPSQGPFPNGMLWILGSTTPLVINSFDSLIDQEISESGDVSLVFDRVDDSIDAASLRVAFSSDLETFTTTAPIPIAGTEIDLGNGLLATIEDQGDTDQITVEIPGTLADPSGRLFIRFVVEQN